MVLQVWCGKGQDIALTQQVPSVHTINMERKQRANSQSCGHSICFGRQLWLEQVPKISQEKVKEYESLA